MQAFACFSHHFSPVSRKETLSPSLWKISAEIADSTLQKDRPVALYCRSGKRSKKAATILSEKGYVVYDLDKGFEEWKKAGKEIEE